MLLNKLLTLVQNRYTFYVLYITFLCNLYGNCIDVVMLLRFLALASAFHLLDKSTCNRRCMYDRIKLIALSTLKLGLADLGLVVAEFIFTLISHAHCLSRTCTVDQVLLGSRMKGLRSVMKSLRDSSILRIALRNLCTFFTESV